MTQPRKPASPKPSAPPSYTPASTPTARDDSDDNALESIGKAVTAPVRGAAEPDEKQQTGESRRPPSGRAR